MNCKFWYHTNNAHFSSISSCNHSKLEFSSKGMILCELINDYIKENGQFKDHVIINFDPSFYTNTSVYYKINYIDTLCEITKNKKNIERKVKAVVLNIHDYDFRIVNNFKSIVQYIDSIAGTKTKNETLNKILQRKIYRNKKIIEDIGVLDYYFENESFHFYYLGYENDSTTKTKSIGLYKTENIFEFAKTPYGKYLIFENDSVFRYIKDETVSKPIIFRWRLMPEDRFVNRPSISNIKEEYYRNDTNWYKTMIVFNYDYLEDKKAIYIPSENFIMTDYKKFEIENIYKKINGVKPQKNTSNPKENNNNYLIYLIVGLSVIVHLVLFFWKRK